jgi:eukaryotic-like serine/threonine-protein kinase
MLPLTPSRLGRYEIVDEIGKGAMGVVYLARDPLIGRLVALKTFRIGYSVRDQELAQFRARFIREAQSAGILSHPNIVTIHDVVEGSEDGTAFIAMEYVRGTNLKHVLQADQPLPLALVADIVAQTADALDYAHSQGVVHRDVKPANIILTADNRVKITDFGIARLNTSNLTQEGQLLGTPNYMAPEQIQGKEVDHRADLFSLGVVLYEMLTHHKPFQGDNLTVVSHRIVYDHFTPPRDYVRELPPGVEAILARALEKDPGRRYQRARELAADLQRAAAQAAGEDLNETQSLSATMVLPALAPPPARATPALWARLREWLAAKRERASRPAAAAATATVPPPPVPVSAAPAEPEPPQPPAAAAPATETGPQPPVPAAPRLAVLPPPRRLGLLLAAAMVALLLGFAAKLLWRSWSPPLRWERTAAEAARPTVWSLLNEGHRLLRSGDPRAAAEKYRQAERLAPALAASRRMRVAAEQQADELDKLVGRERESATKVLEARQALKDRRYDEASAAATAVLVVDPANAEAQKILADVQTARERVARLAATHRAATPAATAPTPAPVSTAPAPGPAREAAPDEGKPATLQIVFYTEMPEGTLMVLANKEWITQQPFSFYEGSFLRRRGKPGWVRVAHEVTPGNVDIKIYVTPAGRSAVVKSIAGNFLGGAVRRLDIQMSASGVLTANLN